MGKYIQPPLCHPYITFIPGLQVTKIIEILRRIPVNHALIYFQLLNKHIAKQLKQLKYTQTYYNNTNELTHPPCSFFHLIQLNCSSPISPL